MLDICVAETRINAAALFLGKPDLLVEVALLKSNKPSEGLAILG